MAIELVSYNNELIKTSCTKCIHGHRTSTCQHYDRVLVEVKKPGRPQVCQCHLKGEKSSPSCEPCKRENYRYFIPEDDRPGKITIKNGAGKLKLVWHPEGPSKKYETCDSEEEANSRLAQDARSVAARDQAPTPVQEPSQHVHHHHHHHQPNLAPYQASAYPHGPPHNQTMPQTYPDQTMFNTSPDQTMFNTSPDQPMFRTPPDQTMFNAPPDQSWFNTSPDQNMFNNSPDQNMFNNSPDQNMFNTSPDQSWFTAPPDQMRFTAGLDQMAFTAPPDQMMPMTYPDPPMPETNQNQPMLETNQNQPMHEPNQNQPMLETDQNQPSGFVQDDLFDPMLEQWLDPALFQALPSSMDAEGGMEWSNPELDWNFENAGHYDAENQYQ